MNLDKAIFAGGCFWCTETVFSELQGVEKVISGYIGGHTENPTYKEVCEGTTNHAEAVEITFNPDVITYKELLEIFFTTHDPTTLNRQGNDIGTQYRSEIFYFNEVQKTMAQDVMNWFESQGVFDAPIVTQLSPATTFYPAEEYHQGYFKQNPTQGYCQAVINPKVQKFRKLYASKLKS